MRAKVLGRLGWKPSPHPRACALSCPSPAIYGPGHPTGSQPLLPTVETLFIATMRRLFVAAYTNS